MAVGPSHNGCAGCTRHPDRLQSCSRATYCRRTSGKGRSMPEANAAARRPSGELEASVLAALWAADGRALTPADVQRDLGTALARTTVTPILARLYEKGSVSRTRSGRGY